VFMEKETVLRLLTVLNRPEKVAEVFSALSSELRVRTFDLLYQGWSPQEIADEVDRTRSALQPYLNDFKETGMVDMEGKTYVFTEKGEQVHRILENMDSMHKDLSKLEQFLIENPSVVPEEVLDELEERRST